MSSCVLVTDEPRSITTGSPDVLRFCFYYTECPYNRTKEISKNGKSTRRWRGVFCFQFRFHPKAAEKLLRNSLDFVSTASRPLRHRRAAVDAGRFAFVNHFFQISSIQSKIFSSGRRVSKNVSRFASALFRAPLSSGGGRKVHFHEHASSGIVKNTELRRATRIKAGRIL